MAYARCSLTGHPWEQVHSPIIKLITILYSLLLVSYNMVFDCENLFVWHYLPHLSCPTGDRVQVLYHRICQVFFQGNEIDTITRFNVFTKERETIIVIVCIGHIWDVTILIISINITYLSFIIAQKIRFID